VRCDLLPEYMKKRLGENEMCNDSLGETAEEIFSH
jgi:hypothetical protein